MFDNPFTWANLSLIIRLKMIGLTIYDKKISFWGVQNKSKRTKDCPILPLDKYIG